MPDSSKFLRIASPTSYPTFVFAKHLSELCPIATLGVRIPNGDQDGRPDCAWQRFVRGLRRNRVQQRCSVRSTGRGAPRFFLSRSVRARCRELVVRCATSVASAANGCGRDRGSSSNRKQMRLVTVKLMPTRNSDGEHTLQSRANTNSAPHFQLPARISAAPPADQSELHSSLAQTGTAGGVLRRCAAPTCHTRVHRTAIWLFHIHHNCPLLPIPSPIPVPSRRICCNRWSTISSCFSRRRLSRSRSWRTFSSSSLISCS